MPGAMVTPGAVGTRVIEVDAFGNACSSARDRPIWRPPGSGLRSPCPAGRCRWWASSPTTCEGELAAIVDSQGYLALVVNHGSAAQS